MGTTVVYSTVGRAQYAFDVFSVEYPAPESGFRETQLTDGESVNHNAQLYKDYDWGSGQFHKQVAQAGAGATSVIRGDILTFVSEREGSFRILFKLFPASSSCSEIPLSSFAVPAISPRDVVPFTVTPDIEKFAFHDRPFLGNQKVYYAATREAPAKLLQPWTALYSTSLITGETRRLSPRDTADYSPAISPSGRWIITASNQGRDWNTSQFFDLDLALVIFKSDGSCRRVLTERGGWPTWKDESTVFFHRLAPDGWWSIFKLSLPSDLTSFHHPLLPGRVTPPGIHAFTPAASPSSPYIAVATRRPTVSPFRHIELFHLPNSTFSAVTSLLNPTANHYNPFLSSSTTLGYHRCHGLHPRIPRLDPVLSLLPDVTLLRADGAFPAISPDGSLIAYVPDLKESSGLYIMRRDGSQRHKVFSGLVFGTSWGTHRPGLVYTSHGAIFEPAKRDVQVISISFSLSDPSIQSHKVLSKAATGNNAFPWAAPNGREVVFRSGRSGHKNLWVMGAEGEEEGGVRQLTSGAWTDTMPCWSPNGEWIAFASDRHAPDTGAFQLFLIRPDGNGLRPVLPLATGRSTHPCFSPDSSRLLFASNLAGVSAEPISVPHQFQPYGELFVVGLDGAWLRRVTHNAYEDGTPHWGTGSLPAGELSGAAGPVSCDFNDVTWVKAPADPKL